MKLLSLEPESSASADSAISAYYFQQQIILYHIYLKIASIIFNFLKKYFKRIKRAVKLNPTAFTYTPSGSVLSINQTKLNYNYFIYTELLFVSFQGQPPLGFNTEISIICSSLPTHIP